MGNFRGIMTMTRIFHQALLIALGAAHGALLSKSAAVQLGRECRREREYRRARAALAKPRLHLNRRTRATSVLKLDDYANVGGDLYRDIDAKWTQRVEARTSGLASESADVIVGGSVDGSLNEYQLARDKRLAERDTRRWCLDRCLATGYCDAVEDLWKLSSAQVVKFCEQCAGEDGCTLDYDKADVYIDHLSRA